jgi:uncharacterized membrane protein
LWDSDGTVHALASTGPFGVFAGDINNSGDIIGGSSGSSDPVLWTGPDRHLVPLTAPTSKTVAASINDSGLIVGSVTVDPGNQFSPVDAVKWEAGTHNLVTFGTHDSTTVELHPIGVNHAGDIVGSVRTIVNGIGRRQAALWPAGGSDSDFVLLTHDTDDPNQSRATDIAENGTIVGMVLGSDTHAARWAPIPAHEATDLGTLSGFSDSEAFAINADGVIVGDCTNIGENGIPTDFRATQF